MTNEFESPLSTVLDEMRADIQSRVARGFETPDEIVESAVDVFSAEAASEDLLGPAGEYTVDAISAQLGRESEWPAETDCDRLNQAFDALEAADIVARQDFSCCGTCGSAEMQDEMAEVADSGAEVRGYAFYHGQDTESAAAGDNLFLAYGSRVPTEEASLGIGHEIIATLSRFGFSPVWSGSLAQRILVPITWQRRYAFVPHLAAAPPTHTA